MQCHVTAAPRNAQQPSSKRKPIQLDSPAFTYGPHLKQYRGPSMRTPALNVIFFLATFLGVHMNSNAATPTPGDKSVHVVFVHGAWADGSSWAKVIALLQDKGITAVAVQLPLTTLAGDVATVKRAIALQDGPVILAGHSYGGAVITEAGNDPKVVGLVYVAAFAPDSGESVASTGKPYPAAPLGAELRPDAEGYLSITPKGVAESFAQDLPAKEAKVVWATQGPTNAAVFGSPISTAAWKTKPSWFVVATEDRAIPPALEKAEAERMKATTINVAASHLVMSAHPKEVADLIEKAAKSVAKH
jgi:pimeloyl-ACP methyl ester carboxylesterase